MTGGKLAATILAHRDAGLSPEQTSRRLFAEFGIEVTGQTIRQWLPKIDGDSPKEGAA